MGQEIDTTSFTKNDFDRYKLHLLDETQLLSEWFANGQFAEQDHVGGFELEVWIVDKDCNPLAINESYLKELNSEWVTPELSRFNIELNGEPEFLQENALSKLESILTQSWNHCYQVAETFDVGLVMTGILPSVREEQLVLENMSRMKRYQALNEQVFQQRQGKPITLDIVGHEHLKTTHYDVMLESATTSFQVHWQVPLDESVRAYNASILASAATVAVSANSPFLFDKDLWAETRIPLFEQSVAVGGINGAAFGPVRRVGFGSGYARDSLMELFQENLDHYPVLLPVNFNTSKEEMEYVRLHNGTIWRWNRPLIGFDAQQKPHVRIEHRVIAAGPTITDSMANAAFYYGLARYLSQQEQAPESEIPFSVARDNFYACAKQGLNAHVTWSGDRKGTMKQLLQQQLLSFARKGLQSFGLHEVDIDYYLGIIQARVETGQHGAEWQRLYHQKYQCDMQTLTAAYAAHQQTGLPVHQWGL